MNLKLCHDYRCLQNSGQLNAVDARRRAGGSWHRQLRSANGPSLPLSLRILVAGVTAQAPSGRYWPRQLDCTPFQPPSCAATFALGSDNELNYTAPYEVRSRRVLSNPGPMAALLKGQSLTNSLLCAALALCRKVREAHRVPAAPAITSRRICTADDLLCRLSISLYCSVPAAGGVQQHPPVRDT